MIQLFLWSIFQYISHLSASHRVSQNVNFLLINGMKIGHSAIDFFLISNSKSVSVKDPVFHNLLVKESLIFSHAKGDPFPSVFEGGFRKKLIDS
jgi:hypothetical protein